MMFVGSAGLNICFFPTVNSVTFLQCKVQFICQFFHRSGGIQEFLPASFCGFLKFSSSTMYEQALYPRKVIRAATTQQNLCISLYVLIGHSVGSRPMCMHSNGRAPLSCNFQLGPYFIPEWYVQDTVLQRRTRSIRIHSALSILVNFETKLKRVTVQMSKGNSSQQEDA